MTDVASGSDAARTIDMAGPTRYRDPPDGDYYEIFDLSPSRPGEAAVVVADASGHGESASQVMTAARTLMRQGIGKIPIPDLLIAHVNQALIKSSNELAYVTVFYLIVDAREQSVVWVGAGHPPAISYRAHADEFGLLNSRDISLSYDPAHESQVNRVALPDGLVGIAIYSGGVTEARNAAGTAFDEDGVNSVIRRAIGRSASETCTMLEAELGRFTADGRCADDTTFAVVKGHPAGGAPVDHVTRGQVRKVAPQSAGLVQR